MTIASDDNIQTVIRNLKDMLSEFMTRPRAPRGPRSSRVSD